MKLMSLFLTLAFLFSGFAEAKSRRHHRRYGNQISRSRCPYAGSALWFIYCPSRSPLVIQLIPGKEEPQMIDLTSPEDGVIFDLQGARATRTSNPKKISWFTVKSVRHNYILALPAADGSVNGINELFGNNTLGSDGTFANDGYQALAKWDANSDGNIDARDEVFSRLRLWSDKNLNGIAEANELHTLAELEVESISLNYTGKVEYTDTYGNQIAFPSIVYTKDGLRHVMYDIWFR
jgi:hypothetical protein